MVQVQFVRVFEGKKRMEVFFRTREGEARKVTYVWQDREETDTPPVGWLKICIRELKLQDSERRRGGLP